MPPDQLEPRVKKESREKQERLDLKGQLGHRESLVIRGPKDQLVEEDQLELKGPGDPKDYRVYEGHLVHKVLQVGAPFLM